MFPKKFLELYYRLHNAESLMRKSWEVTFDLNPKLLTHPEQVKVLRFALKPHLEFLKTLDEVLAESSGESSKNGITTGTCKPSTSHQPQEQGGKTSAPLRLIKLELWFSRPTLPRWDDQGSVRLNKKKKVYKHFPLSRWSHWPSGTGILPGHPCPAGTARKAKENLPHGRQSRLITPPAKKNRAFPTGNALLYISLSHGVWQGASYSGAHPLFLSKSISTFLDNPF